MKKLLIPLTLLSLFFASCQKQSATPAATSTPTRANFTSYAKVDWKKVWQVVKGVLIGPEVSFSYKSGYFEATPTTANPDAFKCHPGDAVCEFTIKASWLGGDDNGNPFPDGYGEATMGFDEKGKLKIAIPKASMTQATFDEHYADKMLTIPADWMLQKDLSRALGLPDGYTVPQGDYPIETIEIEGVSVLMTTFQ